MNPRTIAFDAKEYGGIYDKDENQNDLWVVCWNIRNFSTNLSRPGSRGNGVALDIRLHQLINYVEAWKPDVMFIIECGPDASDICSSLEKGLKNYIAWTNQATNDDGESYIVLLEKQFAELVVEVNNKTFDLYGDEVDKGDGKKFRRPALLRLKSTGGYVCLLVLHAPASPCSLTNRINVITTAIKSCTTQFPNDDIILCGDLNIAGKEKEFNTLQSELDGLNFAHAGPWDTGGGPLETSLRKYETILMTEDSESQPYDQVWHYSINDMSVPSCFTFLPKDIHLKVEEFIWSELSKDIKLIRDIPRLTGSNGKILSKYWPDRTAEKSEIKNAKKISSDYEIIQSNVLKLSQTGEKTLKLFQKEDLLLPTWKYSLKIEEAKNEWFHLKNRSGFVYTADDCNYIPELMREYNEIASKVVNLYYSYCGESSLARQACLFEMAMSDHKPVVFCIRYRQ